MRLAMAIAVLLLAGCAAPADDSPADPEGSDQAEDVGEPTGPDALARDPTQPLPSEDIELDASRDLYTEVCDVTRPVMTYGVENPEVHFTKGQSEAIVSFTWTAANPTMAELNFWLYGADDAWFHLVGGPSPQTVTLTAEDIATVGVTPDLVAYPACVVGAWVATGQQTVAVHIDHRW